MPRFLLSESRELSHMSDSYHWLSNFMIFDGFNPHLPILMEFLRGSSVGVGEWAPMVGSPI